jgi:hypothetical protein
MITVLRVMKLNNSEFLKEIFVLVLIITIKLVKMIFVEVYFINLKNIFRVSFYL